VIAVHKPKNRPPLASERRHVDYALASLTTYTGPFVRTLDLDEQGRMEPRYEPASLWRPTAQ
jgi:hypothetical protein